MKVAADLCKEQLNAHNYYHYKSSLAYTADLFTNQRQQAAAEGELVSCASRPKDTTRAAGGPMNGALEVTRLGQDWVVDRPTPKQREQKGRPM